MMERSCCAGCPRSDSINHLDLFPRIGEGVISNWKGLASRVTKCGVCKVGLKRGEMEQRLKQTRFKNRSTLTSQQYHTADLSNGSDLISPLLGPSQHLSTRNLGDGPSYRNLSEAVK